MQFNLEQFLQISDAHCVDINNWNYWQRSMCCSAHLLTTTWFQGRNQYSRYFYRRTTTAYSKIDLDKGCPKIRWSHLTPTLQADSGQCQSFPAYSTREWKLKLMIILNQFMTLILDAASFTAELLGFHAFGSFLQAQMLGEGQNA